MKKRINEEEMEETAKRLRGEGYTLSEIGEELGISKSSVQKILEKIDKRAKLGELRMKEMAEFRCPYVHVISMETLNHLENLTKFRASPA